MIDRRELIAMLAVGAHVGRGFSPPAPGGGGLKPRPTYPIGLGTWQTFDVADPKPLAPVLSTFVQLGGQVIDSSPMYGRSETVVGDLAASLGIRNKLFVATKVWTSGRDAGIRQMKDSERKLRGKVRSEERRVGKECRSRWSAVQ